MGKFSKAPQTEIVKAFISSAGKDIIQPDQIIDSGLKEYDTNSDSNSNIGININSNNRISDTNHEEKGLPWERHNLKSVKKMVFNLRLNQYYIEALRNFAKPEEGISMQSIASSIVMRELDKMIKEFIMDKKNRSLK